MMFRDWTSWRWTGSAGAGPRWRAPRTTPMSSGTGETAAARGDSAGDGSAAEAGSGDPAVAVVVGPAGAWRLFPAGNLTARAAGEGGSRSTQAGAAAADGARVVPALPDVQHRLLRASGVPFVLALLGNWLYCLHFGHTSKVRAVFFLFLSFFGNFTIVLLPFFVSFAV